MDKLPQTGSWLPPSRSPQKLHPPDLAGATDFDINLETHYFLCSAEKLVCHNQILMWQKQIEVNYTSLFHTNSCQHLTIILSHLAFATFGSTWTTSSSSGGSSSSLTLPCGREPAVSDCWKTRSVEQFICFNGFELRHTNPWSRDSICIASVSSSIGNTTLLLFSSPLMLKLRPG